MNWNTGLLPIEAQMDIPPEVPGERPAEPPSALPEQALLIDVRSYAEYMQGHLPGAHCLPLPKLDVMIHELAPDPQTPLIVYCASGARAELALGQLQRLGYRQAHYGGAAMALAKQLRLPLSAGM